MYWWVELSYPDAFDLGKDGFPRTGQVVKYYREHMKGKALTQSELAERLGVTEQRVRDIENRDAELHVDRRKFLCELLGIPPILLSVQTLEEARQLIERNKAGSGAIDTEEYRTHLALCWHTDFKYTAQSMVPNLLYRIDTLYHNLYHEQDKATLQELLCEYHSFIARRLTDQQCYDVALVHQDKALHFAELLNSKELIALNLLRKGCTLGDMNRVTQAGIAYKEAMQYERHLPTNLRFAILAHAGVCYAKEAAIKRDHAAGEAAIALIDRAGSIVYSNPHADNPHLVDFSLQRYHITKGAALIEIGRNKTAINELTTSISDNQPRRDAYNTILQAQAYYNRGKYDFAASYAETGLVVAQTLNSVVNIARVEKIYQQLRDSPYKNKDDVAALEHLLRARNTQHAAG